MKLIVHVGPPKTGTTALQRALFQSHHDLLGHSVLYPDPKSGTSYNHGQLCDLFLRHSQIPRGMKDISEAEFRANGRALRKQIELQVKDHAPEVLILSSEWFVRIHNAENAQAFIDFVESLGADAIEFLLYARRPSDFFLSASQQRLRASSLFQPIFEWNLNEITEGLNALAPQHKVTVRTFDRTALIGGSIVSDFVNLYIPHCAELLTRPNISSDSNQSLSAETMAILQDFRRAHFMNQQDKFNRPTRKIRLALQRLDAADGSPRPKLLSGWRDFLDYGDSRALILRDTQGIEFPNFDYTRLERADFAAMPDRNRDVADFVAIDADRLRRMIERVGQSSWSPTRQSAKWLRDVAHRMGTSPRAKLPLWRKILSW